MTSPENIDAAEDRDEFIKRMDHIFNYCCRISEQDFRRCILTNDTAQLQIFNDNLATWEAKKDQWIADYDAAVDVEGRRAVVGSVTPNGLPK